MEPKLTALAQLFSVGERGNYRLVARQTINIDKRKTIKQCDSIYLCRHIVYLISFWFIVCPRVT